MGENRTYLENRTYVSMSFFGIRGHYEVGIYVGVVRINLKGVEWNSFEMSYSVRRAHV